MINVTSMAYDGASLSAYGEVRRMDAIKGGCNLRFFGGLARLTDQALATRVSPLPAQLFWALLT